MPDPELQTLLELTQIPTAAGLESRVIAWLDRWLADRPGVGVRTDPHGNRELFLESAPSTDAPLYFTGHLDHPAFAVIGVVAPSVIEAEFRGGVMKDYFVGTPVEWWPTGGEAPIRGTITDEGQQEKPNKSWLIELDEEADVRVGDLVRWALPDAEIIEQDLGTGDRGDVIYTHACDDLAAVAAALCTLDRLRARAEAGEEIGDVRVLLTLAEEIGFIGAIGASRDGFMPPKSRVIALENSRSFIDSPIGGGPIVRVGDRLSIFSPGLTASICEAAKKLAKHEADMLATEKKRDESAAWRWQRKLMAGGACEASVFTAFGYEATCVCLPLGNYHNMADLDRVQAGTNTEPPTIAREHVAIRDYVGMIDLLEACALDLPGPGDFRDKLDTLWDEGAAVLGGG
ncbi:MAG: hypothetical protein AAGI17_05825 [Planctomycetota bacterium]